MALPFLSRLEARPEIEAPAAIAAASLRSDRFRLEREGDWRRLEAIIAHLERGRGRKLSDADLLDLPVLYRKAVSSLAVAREISLDAATLTYLEALVRRAWFQIHGPRLTLPGWLRRFLGGGWSGAVRAIWLDICIAFAVMIAGALAGWRLVARDSDWFFALVPDAMASGRVPGADPEILRASLDPAADTQGLSVFAAYLFSNNSGVAIMAFALGFAFGIPTLLLLLHNMALLGAMAFVFVQAGLGWDFAAWLAVHGTTELGAILLAGAAGLHIGRAMAFPGRRAVLASARAAGGRAALVMAGCTLMLVVAGLLEGYARQLVGDAAGRATIGLGMAAFWIGYFVLARPAAEESA